MPDVPRPTLASSPLAPAPQAVVTKGEKGYHATLRDTDAGQSIESRIWPTLEAATAYAKDIAAQTPLQKHEAQAPDTSKDKLLGDPGPDQCSTRVLQRPPVTTRTEVAGARAELTASPASPRQSRPLAQLELLVATPRGRAGRRDRGTARQVAPGFRVPARLRLRSGRATRHGLTGQFLRASGSAGGAVAATLFEQSSWCPRGGSAGAPGRARRRDRGAARYVASGSRVLRASAAFAYGERSRTGPRRGARRGRLSLAVVRRKTRPLAGANRPAAPGGAARSPSLRDGGVSGPGKCYASGRMNPAK